MPHPLFLRSNTFLHLPWRATLIYQAFGALVEACNFPRTLRLSIYKRLVLSGAALYWPRLVLTSIPLPSFFKRTKCIAFSHLQERCVSYRSCSRFDRRVGQNIWQSRFLDVTKPVLSLPIRLRYASSNA